MTVLHVKVINKYSIQTEGVCSSHAQNEKLFHTIFTTAKSFSALL